MAYMNQERKNKLAPKIKEVLDLYGFKGTLKTDNHTLYVTIRSGPHDLMGEVLKMQIEAAKEGNRRYGRSDPLPNDPPEYYNTNVYHLDTEWGHNYFLKMFFHDLKAAMMEGNWDNSDPQSDYFDVGWYCDIKIGEYNNPYRLVKD